MPTLDPHEHALHIRTMEADISEDDIRNRVCEKLHDADWLYESIGAEAIRDEDALREHLESAIRDDSYEQLGKYIAEQALEYLREGVE